ncbi:zinc-binding dehydrogenase [Mesorhizobium sp. M1312]|uniref:zinc-binding dehydrogenase n=1 Tax=unclassified Mesorhizobium TaxID=325217 RepID=UPI003338F312
MGNYVDYRTVMKLIFKGSLRPVISDVIPFEKAADAMATLERGEQFGKLVLAH